MKVEVSKPLAYNCSVSNNGEEGWISVTAADGVPKTIRSENRNFKAALEAFKEQDWERLYLLMEPEKAVREALEYEGVEVRDGAVYYRGHDVHNVVVDRILQFLDLKLDPLPLVKFLRKLLQNPSGRAVNELYKFLEKNELTVTTNGNFLGYKAVDLNFYSFHSGNTVLVKGTVKDGHIYNGVGEEIIVERNSVDDDPQHGCSYGLHVGTYKYAKEFGGDHSKFIMVLVEVNPADVVSVPYEDCAKLRACAYKVVSVCKDVLDETKVYKSRYFTAVDDNDGDDEDYSYENYYDDDED